MEAAAIQCLCLMEFIKLLCLVDESTILILPYKSYFALKGEVLFEPDKLGQSYTIVSKHFKSFSSN